MKSLMLKLAPRLGLSFGATACLQLDADRRIADVLELALYNGVLSGVSMDGGTFFYENPLASSGDHHRHTWFKCACCPPNVARLLTSIGGYVYSVTESDIFVHLYLQSSSSLPCCGQRITLRQETRYPWDGAVQIQVGLEKSCGFGVNLRIPGWSRRFQLSVNGEDLHIDSAPHHGYVRIERTWQPGDIITLHLDMSIERVYAHPDVSADTGRVALQRGPLLFCLESADNPIPLHRIQLSATAALDSQFIPTLLGGVMTIRGTAETLEVEDWEGALYRTEPARPEPYPFVAIPYYAWDSRQSGEMCVWIREGNN